MNTNQIVHTGLRVSKPHGNYSETTKAHNSPVKFDPINGTLILKGKITLRDLHHFYFPIKSQLAMHLEKKQELIVGIFLSDLDFANVKMLFELFTYVRRVKKSGASIKVKWFISPFDAHLLDIAQDFEQLFKVGTENVLTRVQY